jgi:EAL domain-containing protein (putative c-di-GMP-specific phosphodiesterase class I)
MRFDEAEALVRWQHPRDGLIHPAEFIPLAERTGLIKQLSVWALGTALQQCRLWHDKQKRPARIAVNLAPANLEDERLVEILLGLLEYVGASPQWLTLEVTEGAMMTNPVKASYVLGNLHEMGVQISIDDFGTGYSSLGYLKDLPVDEVKVDRAFVTDMATHEKNACIVRSVIELGHNLGLRVAAEGVEDRASLELLASWDCDLAQGYYLSRPLADRQFSEWMDGAHLAMN